MPSAANRKQIMAVVMCEALADMLADQGGFDDDHFKGVHADLKAACNAAYPVMIADPNGGLTSRLIEKEQAAIDRFRDLAFRECRAPDATSFCIDLIHEQVVRCTNRAKREAFRRIFEAMENLHTYFDPDWRYDAPDGYQAARVFGGVVA